MKTVIIKCTFKKYKDIIFSIYYHLNQSIYSHILDYYFNSFSISSILGNVPLKSAG